MRKARKPSEISKKAALDLIQDLATRISHKICCYHHRDYVKGKPPDWRCDCKYLLGVWDGQPFPHGWDGKQDTMHFNSEQTGCCEARLITSLVKRLRKKT